MGHFDRLILVGTCPVDQIGLVYHRTLRMLGCGSSMLSG